MGVRVPTEDFRSRLEHFIREQLSTAEVGYSNKIDPALAKERLAPDLYDRVCALIAKGKTPTISTLAVDYAKVLAANVQDAAKRDGGPKWLSIAEARSLPASGRIAYKAMRHSAEYSAAYDRALDEPFPGGRVDHDLFFERHLPMLRKRTLVSLIEAADVMKRTEALAADLQANGPKTLPSGVKLSLDSDGKIHAEGSAGHLSAKAQSGTLHLSFGSEQVYRQTISYEEQSIFERVAEYSKDTRKVLAEIPKEGKRSESQNISDRFTQSIDVEPMTEWAKILAEAAGDSSTAGKIDALAKAGMRRHDVAAGKYLAAAGVTGQLRSVAEAIEQHGEQCLGDADLTIRLGDQLDVTTWDDDGNESQKTLLSGAGPLLIFANHASGVRFAVDRQALAQDDLSIAVFHEDEPEGHIRMSADGVVQSMCSFRALYSLTFDVGWAKGDLAELE